MTLTPQDIQTQEFNVRFRGFDVEEVDKFLEQVATEFLLLNNKMEKLNSEIAEFQDKGKAFTHAFLSAQEIADNLVEKAQAEAKTVLEAARKEAEEIINAAKDEAASLKNEIDRLQELRDKSKNELQGVLNNYISMLDVPSSKPKAKDAKKADAPKAENKKGDAPKADNKKAEAKADEKKAEEPKAEEPKSAKSAKSEDKMVAAAGSLGDLPKEDAPAPAEELDAGPVEVNDGLYQKIVLPEDPLDTTAEDDSIISIEDAVADLKMTGSLSDIDEDKESYASIPLTDDEIIFDLNDPLDVNESGLQFDDLSLKETN